MQKRFIGILLVLVLFLLFALKNNQLVELDLYFWKFNFNLSFLVLIVLTVGAILSFILSLPGTFSKNKKISQLNKQVSRLETELRTYRSQTEKKADERRVEQKPVPGPENDKRENDLTKKENPLL